MYPPNAFSRFIRLFLLCALLLVPAVPAAAEVDTAAPAPYSQEDQPAPPAPVPIQDPSAVALRAEMDELETAWEQGPDVFLAWLETSSPEAREVAAGHYGSAPYAGIGAR